MPVFSHMKNSELKLFVPGCWRYGPTVKSTDWSCRDLGLLNSTYMEAHNGL